MPGPLPKRNPARGSRPGRSPRTLSADPDLIAPELPERDWHPMTLAWWQDIWSSPMAGEYLQADEHALVRLALLVDDFWVADNVTARRDVAAEIRLQQRAFGLTPIDRRRLQWEVERTETATAKGKRRRQGEPAADPSDPRDELRRTDR